MSITSRHKILKNLISKHDVLNLLAKKNCWRILNALLGFCEQYFSERHAKTKTISYRQNICQRLLFWRLPAHAALFIRGHHLRISDRTSTCDEMMRTNVWVNIDDDKRTHICFVQVMRVCAQWRKTNIGNGKTQSYSISWCRNVEQIS